MSVKVTGLREFERKLKDIGERAQKLQGPTNVPLSELLTAEFLKTPEGHRGHRLCLPRGYGEWH
jgi:hypothetical protein